MCQWSTADWQNGDDGQQEKKNQPEDAMDRLQEGLWHDATLMADRMPGNIFAEENTIKFLKNTMPN